MKTLERTLLILLFFCLTLFSSVFALDQTSMRMKGLGTSMQGIISDDYTDTIANPARERYWRQKQLIAKAGLYGNPMTLGYAIGEIPVFLLAEGIINKNATTYNTFSNNPHWNLPTNTIAQEYISSYKNNLENYSLIAISGFGSNTFGVGVGLFYDVSRNFSVSDSFTANKIIRGGDGQTVYRARTGQKQQSVTTRNNPQAVLGLHWRDEGEAQKDKDLIFKVVFLKNKTLASRLQDTSADYDPDGDGNNDQYGTVNPIVTPDNYSTLDYTAEDQNPAYQTGAGVEWREKKTTKNAKTGHLFSLSWQPGALKNNSSTHHESQTISGTTTTAINSDTLKQLREKTDSYSGVFGVGGLWQIQERLWVGSGVRLEGTLTQTKQMTYNIYSGAPAYSFRSKLDNFSSTLGIPFLFELTLTPNFMLRGNVTGQWLYSRTEQTMTNLYFDPVKQTTSASRTTAIYGFGVGYQWKGLGIDVFTSYDPYTASLYQLQCNYKFD